MTAVSTKADLHVRCANRLSHYPVIVNENPSRLLKNTHLICGSKGGGAFDATTMYL